MIIENHLPNLRWLSTGSENLGRDWFAKEASIDSFLPLEGYDLSDESTYLLFSHKPQDVLDGEGECLVARAVIGPKKNLITPWKLIDWRASRVWQKELTSTTMDEMLLESISARKEALDKVKNLSDSFFLRVRRELDGDLKVSIEVIFHE